MPSRSRPKISRVCAVALLVIFSAAASEQRGRVMFGGLPVPGATITATQSKRQFGAISDAQGWYSFANLADGTWTFRIEMLCFATIQQDVTVAPGAPISEWKLTLPPFTGPVTPLAAPAPEEENKPADAAVDDGFLINGSTNNGADSPFSQSAAFGNNRRSRRGLYTGGIGLTLGNSALDAQSFSLTGQQTAKPSYNRIQGLLSLGGPLRIPHLLPNGPNFILNYQWTRDRDVNTQAARMPTAAERNGDLGGGAAVPASRISPQAQALLRFYHFRISPGARDTTTRRRFRKARIGTHCNRASPRRSAIGISYSAASLLRAYEPINRISSDFWTPDAGWGSTRELRGRIASHTSCL